MSSSQCSACRAPITPSGRASHVVGKRFCMKRACQAAKQRQYRELRRNETTSIEDRPCFCCGEPLLARPERVTDSEVGRWCPRRECQRDRAARLKVDAAVKEGAITTELIGAVARLFREAHTRRRVVCSECGRGDAVAGYPHFTPDHSSNCKGTGNFPVTREDLPFAWPEETLPL